MAEKESFYIGQTDTIWGGDCGEVYIADGEKVLVYYAKQLLDDLPSLYEFPPPFGPGWENQPLATVRLIWEKNYFLTVAFPPNHLQHYYVRENLHYWYIG